MQSFWILWNFANCKRVQFIFQISFYCVHPVTSKARTNHTFCWH